MTLLAQLGRWFSGAAEAQDLGVAPDAVVHGSEEEKIREALFAVIDPEVGINVVDLGLVYGIRLEAERVDVFMSMTTPACPLGPMIQSNAKRAVLAVAPDKDVNVTIVWKPPWGPERMSRYAKQLMGLE